MADNQSASRIAADILIAAIREAIFSPNYKQSPDSLANSFRTIHQAVLDAQKKEPSNKTS